eukprot:34182-Rhodomonas_salina.1
MRRFAKAPKPLAENWAESVEVYLRRSGTRVVANVGTAKMKDMVDGLRVGSIQESELLNPNP